MTVGCVLSCGTYSVDFKNLNVTISHAFSNPVMTLDTPIASKADVLGTNTKCINIGFTRNNINLTFTLTDGPGTFSFGTPSTNYEKIIHMANYIRNAKTITINGQAFYCHITSVNIPWAAGLKNLSTNGSISLVLSANITMGDPPSAPS
jgi:hypothetical protein